jgi:hypothetical protein
MSARRTGFTAPLWRVAWKHLRGWLSIGGARTLLTAETESATGLLEILNTRVVEWFLAGLPQHCEPEPSRMLPRRRATWRILRGVCILTLLSKKILLAMISRTPYSKHQGEFLRILHPDNPPFLSRGMNGFHRLIGDEPIAVLGAEGSRPSAFSGAAVRHSEEVLAPLTGMDLTLIEVQRHDLPRTRLAPSGAPSYELYAASGKVST